MTTLRQLYLSLDRFGDQPAIQADGVTTSYRALAEQANQLAHFLIEQGVGPDSVVALMMRNRIEYVIADQALIRLGATMVPLNTMLGADEINFILRDSEAELALCDEVMKPFAMTALDDPNCTVRTVIAIGENADADRSEVINWADAFGDRPTTVPPMSVRPDGRALLVYTGGTTGKPKGVIHSQERLSLNILAQTIEIGIDDSERMLLISPLPHSAGLLMRAGLLKGAYLFIESAFDPGLVLDRIEQDQVSFFFAVPTMIYRLIDRAKEASTGRPVDVSSMRTLLYGAAPITQERLIQGLELFGPVFMQLYGQTEAPNFITRLRRQDHDVTNPARLTSCGLPATMAQVRIVDEAGADQPAGDTGEVVAYTPYTMIGYHGMPEKTAQTLRDGWLHTGDLGYLDADGYLFLVDRKNDMIITGGMNVYSSEVEQAISGFPGVTQVAVVGVPDPDWGEAVVAFVVARDASVASDAIIGHCRERLSKYKVPKAVRIVTEIPLTTVGKLDKATLRKQAAATAGSS